jgi:arylsulfatase
MPTRPNILLIQVDQWRGDCLSIAGHPVVHTPYLDRLASDGARFTRACSSTPVCIPARAALMTGLGPRAHGRVGYEDGVPWDYPVTLAGEFSRHGYQSHAIGKLHAHPSRHALGFGSVELHDGFLHFARERGRRPDLAEGDDYLAWLRRETGRADADYFEHGVNCNSVVARPWDKEERLHPTNWVVSRALDFFTTRDAAKPFLLYLSFHRPHPPYDPPAWAFEQYLHQPMPPPPVGDWAEDFAGHDQSHLPDAFRARYRADILQRARAGYYGHMTHIDHQLNRLIETLQEHGLHRDTWICFTSDHGEMLGDHHLFRKGYPYEGSTRVPLLLKGPAGSVVAAGHVSDVVVEQRDILPTLLDCAGLPVPASIEGRSFLPAASGDATPLRDCLHGELLVLGESMQWLTDGREKYIWRSQTGCEQLFDLRADPTECHDLARAPTAAVAARLAHWRARLVTELTGREEGFVQAGRLVPGRPVRPTLSRLASPAPL